MPISIKNVPKITIKSDIKIELQPWGLSVGLSSICEDNGRIYFTFFLSEKVASGDWKSLSANLFMRIDAESIHIPLPDPIFQRYVPMIGWLKPSNVKHEVDIATLSFVYKLKSSELSFFVN